MARTVALNLALNGVQGVVSGLGQVAGAAKKTGDSVKQDLGGALGSLEKSAPHIDKIGSSLLKVGALAAGGLAAAGKAAMDWESAWTGVLKTVDGSAAELDALQGSLREMARTLPASHQDITAVAEAAGQLGVKTQDISAFTRTMIDLGNTTNLTADEAATSLAQFMNVMGTSGKDVGRLGAAVVALGNAGTSTEKDIVDMAQRIAGAGKTVGMSEAQVLSYASALSSAGINAEAGGTAISQSLLKMDTAVRNGGARLDILAKISGKTSEEFAKAWRDDASGAMNTFLKGLAKAQTEGKNTTAILEDLGITGIRESDALRRLALSGDLLADSLKLGGQAWQDSSALAAEAMKRYETSSSKMQVALNNLTDAGIDLGSQLLPTVVSLAQGAADTARWFGQLPGPLKAGIMAMGGVVAVGGLAGGSILKLATSSSELAASWAAIKTASPGVASGMSRVATAAGVVSAALIALTMYQAQVQAEFDKTRVGADDIASTMLKMGQSYKLDDLFRLTDKSAAGPLKQEINGVADALRRIKSEGGLEKAIGGSATLAGKAAQQFAQVDKALMSLAAAGRGDEVARQFGQIASKAREAGMSSDELLRLFPALKGQYEMQAAALGNLVLSADEYADWMGGKVPAAVAAAQRAQEGAAGSASKVKAEYEKQKVAVKDAAEALFEYANVALALSGNAIGFEAAIDNMTAALKENGRTVDINTEKGRANVSALNQMASASGTYIEALVKNGATTAEVTAVTQRAREEFVNTATKMGMTKDAAQALADKYGLIPKNVATQVQMLIDQNSMNEVERTIQWASRTRQVSLRVTATGALQAGNYTAIQAAQGGLVDYYGAGGLREQHVAQIAPAGSWRVWAEPETGGEAYIPLAREKWERSRQIWWETGKRIGMVAYADGGINQSYRPTVNVAAGAAPHVEVAVLLDGAVLRDQAHQVFVRDSGSLATAKRRAGR